MSGHVSVIGAGPGDPGLISVRGLQLLSRADVVIYDRAAASLLRWARHDAETIEAGEPAEVHPEMARRQVVQAVDVVGVPWAAVGVHYRVPHA